ncbi:MAG TPA: hypothetical protein VKB57_11120 [Acidimicrobiales bacterium]|nr:hypothetical protein [Acidimicrobiales bacterium]
MRVRTALGGAIAASVLVGLTACGGPRYHYVQNDDFGVYAKLPSSWTIHDEKQLFPELSAQELKDFHQSNWMRTFTGHGLKADKSLLFVGDSGEPVGMVKIQALTPEIREQISLASLRGFAALNDGSKDLMQDPNVKVVKDEPVSFKGGFHGVRTVFETPIPDGGGATAVVDSTALLNDNSTIMYVFKVTCTTKCYFETHKDEIAKAVDSWTIQEVRS